MLGVEGVVPVAVEAVAGDRQRGDLVVADLDARGGGELLAHRVIRPALDNRSTRPGWSWVWAAPADIAAEAAGIERKAREEEEALARTTSARS